MRELFGELMQALAFTIFFAVTFTVFSLSNKGKRAVRSKYDTRF